jgi:hypothetical protein
MSMVVMYSLNMNPYPSLLLNHLHRGGRDDSDTLTLMAYIFLVIFIWSAIGQVGG